VLALRQHSLLRRVVLRGVAATVTCVIGVATDCTTVPHMFPATVTTVGVTVPDVALGGEAALLGRAVAPAVRGGGVVGPVRGCVAVVPAFRVAAPRRGMAAAAVPPSSSSVVLGEGTVRAVAMALVVVRD